MRTVRSPRVRTVALAIEARLRFPRVCVELVILVSSARSVSEEKIDDVYVCVVDCAEYFQCQSNGRFADPYNCARGKYFECNFSEKSKTRQPWTMPSSACCSLDIGLHASGILYTRTCPAALRFNVLMDQCDYPQNVPCLFK